MKRVIFFALITLFTLTACIVVRGSGDVVTEERNVSGFDRVELHGSGKLILAQGSAEALTVEAEDNLMKYIETDVRGNTLMLGFEDGVIVQTRKPIIFYLTMVDIAGVDVSGTGDVEAARVETDRLDIGISGSGSVDIAGQSTEQTVRINGSGKYNANEMESEITTIDVSGSGEAAVWVTDQLTVDISGSGDVQYYGNPRIMQEISGSGSIEGIDGR